MLLAEGRGQCSYPSIDKRLAITEEHAVLIDDYIATQHGEGCLVIGVDIAAELKKIRGAHTKQW